jgi:hypothetical protein
MGTHMVNMGNYGKYGNAWVRIWESMGTHEKYGKTWVCMGYGKLWENMGMHETVGKYGNMENKGASGKYRRMWEM